MSEKHLKSDGWRNIASGMGGKNDKSRHTTFESLGLIDDLTLCDLYTDDGTAANILLQSSTI